MTFYAESTEVPIDRTKAEIDRLLQRHGASQRVTAHDDEQGRALLAFSIANRQIRVQIPLPSLEAWPDPNKRDWETKRKTPNGWNAWTVQRRAQWVRERFDQASRTRWRAVLLILKAKLELIEIGLSTVEREFLADIALPDGSTVGERLKTDLAIAYSSGKMPPLLGPAKERA